MKIFVKTLKGTSFEIEAKPEDTVYVVKNNIQNSQGIGVYPADQQILIHQGRILKNETTLDENKVSDNSFIVIMLNKARTATDGVSTSTNIAAPPASSFIPARPTPVSAPAISPAVAPVTAPATPPTAALTPVPAATPPTTATPTPSATPAATEADVYGQAASNLVAGSNLEQTIQGILEMGGGTWDRDTVVRALRAAYNNPDRAIDYLYSGIPDQVDAPAVPIPSGTQTINPPVLTPESAPPAIPSSGPNTNPLDLFPQGIPNVGANAGAGGLDILRNSPQFRTLQAMVQSNPQILQPMLQELAKQNPQIMRLIQEHQGEFLRLINEPAEGVQSNLVGHVAGDPPQSVAVTQEESESIERLEAMGFDRALVLEVFVACNRDEELAANYLLDHMHEFDEDTAN